MKKSNSRDKLEILDWLETIGGIALIAYFVAPPVIAHCFAIDKIPLPSPLGEVKLGSILLGALATSLLSVLPNVRRNVTENRLRLTRMLVGIK